MPTISDAAIRATIRAAKAADRPATLTDGDGKGTGRLRLTIRPMATRTVAEWYAVAWRDGRRTQAKLGSYPAMSLAAARERFATDFARVIQSGASIKTAPSARPGTVADLFTGYADHLAAAGRSSHQDTRQALEKAAAVLGPARLARDVTAADLVAFLGPVYARGSKSMADHLRGYIRAAFAWGMGADRDYRHPGKPRRFDITANPAAGIPTEPKQAGTRWLDPGEFVTVYKWLCTDATAATPHYLAALRLLMLTGQRVREIINLRAEQWDSAARLLTWSRTKNGRPHCIPVAPQAAALLDSLAPSPAGWLFPAATDPTRPVHEEALYSVLWRARARLEVEPFALRDLRRTWKTLAGVAGLTKDARDLLQNHNRNDVSARHYDRHDYLTEKREAVAKWADWLNQRGIE